MDLKGKSKFEVYHSTLEIIGKLFGSTNVKVSPTTEIDKQGYSEIKDNVAPQHIYKILHTYFQDMQHISG